MVISYHQEVIPMRFRKEKFVLTLDDDSYDLIVMSMIEMKNALIREGRYTDAVDEALIKFLKAKKKYIVVT